MLIIVWWGVTCCSKLYHNYNWNSAMPDESLNAQGKLMFQVNFQVLLMKCMQYTYMKLWVHVHNNNNYRQILGLQWTDTRLSSKSMSISEFPWLIEYMTLFNTLHKTVYPLHFCAAQEIHYIFCVVNYYLYV